MSKHKHTDKLCYSIIAITLVVAILFVNGGALGIETSERVLGYEDRLFDKTKVHTLDIFMDDWDGFIENCTNEEYVVCDVTINGERFNNVGIRAKGNTSLSSVAAYGNDRYSFKLEFDQYNSMGSYHGLDKLCLNNLIQDNTYLKDFLTYTMMYDMGAAAPLCSFIWITVNGEDWGLYLAVEGVEDSFLQRNYGADYGELYKPDSMNMGGGRGNGRDFDINNFFDSENQDGENNTPRDNANQFPNFEMPENFQGMRGEMPEGFTLEEGTGEMPNFSGRNRQMPEGFSPNDENFQMPEGFSPNAENFQMPGNFRNWEGNMPEGAEGEQRRNNMGGGMGGGMGGRGSSDVMLKYTDDNPKSYPNIFGNAKTDISDADKIRLIQALKDLSSGENIENTVDIEAVIRYLTVHDFVNNGDSYTGSMVHNYYLYEEDGILSMIPWDYNLAFGNFNMGGGGFMGGSGDSTVSAGMTSSVNSPIDSPVSGGDITDRPMVAWIFENEEYTELYHQFYNELITEYFDSGYFSKMISDIVALISPYVEKEPAAFCTFEEFKKGTDALTEFCLLRAKSISGQLNGTIPSTREGQTADNSSLIDASHISSSDMGGMRMGMGGNRRN